MAPDPSNKVSLYRHPDQDSLSLTDRFTFQCHPGLACFNRCCRTPTIVLSPYDILRLTRTLELSSGEFLQRYTRRVIEPHSNLPLIFMDAYRSAEPGCPLLGPEGCAVYPHRPAACRLFPITMGSQWTETGVLDSYFCRRLEYCRGFDGGAEWTVASWRANQGFEEYDQGRAAWIAILLKAGMQEPGGVDAQVQDLFATLSYDLDRVRRWLTQPAFAEACGLDGEAAEAMGADDSALLRLSYRLLESLLFGAPRRVLLDAALAAAD